MIRNVEKAKNMLGGLPNVTIVKADFTDAKSLEAALNGVDRAMLVSGAGKHEQYDAECDFLAAAKKTNVAGVVRVSTGSCLIHPGTRGVYARAHAGIEAHIKLNKLPVVDLNPNYFMDTILGWAEEMKAAGRISWPVSGDGMAAFVDPRDIGNAAAAILTSDSKTFEKFIAARKIEIHGPKFTSYQEHIAKLAKAVGYEIKINTVSGSAWVDAMVGIGVSKLLAESYLDTIEIVDGKKKPYRAWTQRTSELLLSIYKPRYTVDDWVKLSYVKKALKK